MPPPGIGVMTSVGAELPSAGAALGAMRPNNMLSDAGAGGGGSWISFCVGAEEWS